VTVPRSEAAEKPSAPPPITAAQRAPGRRLTARRLLIAAGCVLAVALLFLAYLRVSRTYPENSDESNDLLMAWDMLHGNVLLHGWYLSDVSFITTELPQYALLVWLFGLHADTAHIAAAMTYTVVVILSVLLARGRVPRREARLRMLLAAALMFAQYVYGGLGIAWLVTALYFILMWHTGGTVGMRALGLRVAREEDGRPIGLGRATARYLGYLVDWLALGIGLLWVGVDSRKQGWHDKIAGTFVVKRA